MDNPIDVAEVIRENEVLRARVMELERTARNVAFVENNYRLDAKVWDEKNNEYVKAIRMHSAFADVAYKLFVRLSLGRSVAIKDVQPWQLVSVIVESMGTSRIIGYKTSKSLFVGVSAGGLMDLYEYEEWSKWKDVRPVILP